MDKIEGLLKIVASSIAVIVPGILLAGYSYHLGYYMTFGLSEDLIPKSMSDVLVESWYVGIKALAWLMSQWPYLVGLFVFYYLLFVIIFLFLLRAKKQGITWIFDEISRENQGRMICGLTQWHWVCLGELFKDLLSWFFAPMVLLAILGAFTIFPYLDGKDDAIEQMEKFQHHGCQGNNRTISCIYLIDTAKQQEKVITKGILVSANKQRIAVFNNKLEIWPLLDSYIIKKHKLEQTTTDVETSKPEE